MSAPSAPWVTQASQATPARATGRAPWRRLLALAALVLAAHALLIAQWLPGARRLGSGHGPSPRPVLLVPPPLPSAARAAPADVPGSPPPAAAAVEPPPPPPATPAAARVPHAGDAPGAWPAPPPAAGEPLAAALPLRPAPAASQPALELDPEAEVGAPPPPAEGAPPPVYATRIPLPAQLRYQVTSRGPGEAAASSGEARLTLRHDGRRYSLQLDAQAGGRPLIEQASSGGFDGAGFAPERFTDRRRGRGWRAANFRRDTGRIGFSGPRIDYPLLPGAQDRLSALVQLGAIVAAAPESAGTGGVQVFVADARGWAELWAWQLDGTEPVDTPLGTLTLAHWRREPARPEGLRVEAWLDPARGHWPARLRYTLLRNGQVLDLLLAAEPAPPP